MPTNKRAKADVRARMERTGESYTTAKKNLETGTHRTGPANVAPAPGGAYVLTANEAALAQRVREQLAAIKQELAANRMSNLPEAISVMGRDAHELHVSLREHGHEPRHNKHILKNRRVAPTDPTFYCHIHPSEDLIDFLRDPHANDDPMDQTIDHEFTFRIYSRRWGHDDTYRIRRTTRGWATTFMQTVEADPDGRVDGEPGTGLFQHLDQDTVNYPEELPGYVEYLWNEAQEQGLSHEQVQDAMNSLAEWVSACERGSPSGLFKGFK